MPRKGHRAMVGRWLRIQQEEREEALRELARELQASRIASRGRRAFAGHLYPWLEASDAACTSKRRPAYGSLPSGPGRAMN